MRQKAIEGDVVRAESAPPFGLHPIQALSKKKIVATRPLALYEKAIRR